MNKLRRWLAVGLAAILMSTGMTTYAKDAEPNVTSTMEDGDVATETDAENKVVATPGDGLKIETKSVTSLEYKAPLEYVDRAITITPGVKNPAKDAVKVKLYGEMFSTDGENYEGTIYKIDIPSKKYVEYSCGFRIDLSGFNYSWRRDSTQGDCFRLVNESENTKTFWLFVAKDSTTEMEISNLKTLPGEFYDHDSLPFKLIGTGKKSINDPVYEVSRAPAKTVQVGDENVAIDSEMNFTSRFLYRFVVPAGKTYRLSSDSRSTDHLEGGRAYGFITDYGYFPPKRDGFKSYLRKKDSGVDCFAWSGETDSCITNSSSKDKVYYIGIYCDWTNQPFASNIWIEEFQPTASISYRTHIQNKGWETTYKKNGEMSGTSGQSLRLEGINIKLEGAKYLGVQYTTHCQDYGWLAWSRDGEMNGTEGESKRLEAIMIQLTGPDKDFYDVYYRVHAQNVGWMGWAKNGEPAGTAGYAYRLEGIQIQLVAKGATLDVNKNGIKSVTTDAYRDKNKNGSPKVENSDIPNVSYRTHVQNVGWQAWKTNGGFSGTSGRSLRLEGINIKLTNKDHAGGIRYKTHIQNIGWEKNWKVDGEMSGTSGRSLRLEAIELELYGEMAQYYDIYYRVHAQNVGWMGWAKNGTDAGTAGYGRRLEGIQVVIVPKNAAAPAANYGGITSVTAQPYISK